jgi:hypothetical protein
MACKHDKTLAMLSEEVINTVQMLYVDSAEKPPAVDARRACRQHYPVAIRRAMSTSQTAP